MKGITCCAECAYYRMKTHKCSRGAKKEPNQQNGDDVRFFADCPLDDFSTKNGKWLETHCDLICGVCKWEYSDELPYMSSNGYDSYYEAFAFCPHCGSRLSPPDGAVYEIEDFGGDVDVAQS